MKKFLRILGKIRRSGPTREDSGGEQTITAGATTRRAGSGWRSAKHMPGTLF